MTEARAHSFRPALTRGQLHVLLPILIALAGAAWIELALRYFARSTGHDRRGVIGYHYPGPSPGFEYEPSGRVIEKWSFHIPGAVILAMLVGSALLASWRLRTQLVSCQG